MPQYTMDLPPIAYKEDEICEEPPIHVPSKIILFDSLNIENLGLKPSATWKQQTEELIELGKPKRVLWIRHGEGIHNAAEKRVGKELWEAVESKKPIYFDPDLNDVGKEQSKKLAIALHPHLSSKGLEVDLIIVSPLIRAIRTAEIAFGSIWETTPVIAVELARERHGKNVCDSRRTVQELKTMFPKVDFDRFMVDDKDVWHTEVRETPEQVRERVKKFMRWLMDLPHLTVAVVGHSDFMSHAVEVAGYSPHWPSNCELVPMLLRLTSNQ